MRLTALLAALQCGCALLPREPVDFTFPDAGDERRDDGVIVGVRVIDFVPTAVERFRIPCEAAPVQWRGVDAGAYRRIVVVVYGVACVSGAGTIRLHP